MRYGLTCQSIEMFFSVFLILHSWNNVVDVPSEILVNESRSNEVIDAGVVRSSPLRCRSQEDVLNKRYRICGDSALQFTVGTYSFLKRGICKKLPPSTVYDKI